MWALSRPALFLMDQFLANHFAEWYAALLQRQYCRPILPSGNLAEKTIARIAMYNGKLYRNCVCHKAPLHCRRGICNHAAAALLLFLLKQSSRHSRCRIRRLALCSWPKNNKAILFEDGLAKLFVELLVMVFLPGQRLLV